MRPPRLLAVSVAALALLAGVGRAGTPLRLIPAEADFVLQVHDPVRALDAVKNLDVLSKVTSLAAIKEQLDSTSARRLRQFVAYFEKSLGDKWPALVGRLASGGAALGLKYGNPNPPLVLVVQGSDEALLEKVLATAVEVLEAELARQESKEKVEKGDYHGVPGFKLGDLWAARAGAALVIANRKEAMQKAIDLHLGREKQSLADHPGLREAAGLLPKSPLASGWLNMVPVQKSPAGKDLYKSPRDNPQLTVLFGQYLDVLGRTPFLCGALSGEKDEFRLTIRAPRGRDGMGSDRLLHLPPKGEPGCRPLLQPKGVLYSSSYYLDFASLWKDRDQLFNKAQADGLAGFEKNSGRFLGGVKISTLLESAGPYQRLVVAHQAARPYKREPLIRLPAVAFVSELRQPERFGRAVDTLLRTAAIFATDTFKVEMKEEKHRDHAIVAYRFNEKAEVKEDVNDLRYNFTPCFVRVGNQFVISSTVELCKQLIDELAKVSPASEMPRRVSGQDRIYSRGFADYLEVIEDQLITQTILDQAVPPGEAKKQAEEVVALLRGLGSLSTSVEFRSKQVRFDVRVKLGK
ncbi:MAG: hypothetical protein U0797_01875 [Gemmataceae bacterium]